VVALAAEPQVYAPAHQPLALHPIAEPGIELHVASALLEHAGPDPRLDVRPASSLEDHGLDAMPLEQTGEQEAGRASPHHRYLGALCFSHVKPLDLPTR
jgi:hypothetical protein